MDYDFNRLLSDAARDLAGQPLETTTLEHVVALGTETVPACDHASITLIEGGAVRTLASTDPALLSAIDAWQQEAGEGPAYDALHRHETALTGDLAHEPRWPRWGARVAAEAGLASLLSFHLFASEASAGTLNLYSTQGDAFDHEDLLEGQVLAAQVSVALATSLKERQLHEALQRRTVIGQATGILIERFGLAPDQAFAVMRRVSQQQNLKVHALAEHLVQTGVLPQYGSARPPEGHAEDGDGLVGVGDD